MRNQQEEALTYFHSAAEGWRKSAEGISDKVNIILQRNNFAEKVALATGAKTALDIGCGTGELVMSLAEKGVKAEGIDFAGDMIRLASDKAGGLKNAKFECVSVFDYKPAQKFDVISANGFIEYISPEEMSDLFSTVHGWLNPGGSFVVGSRNRLFNAFSVNKFTQEEADAGSLPALINEATLIAEAPSMADAISALRNVKTDMRNFEKHPYTGIGVSVRYQYTPAQLIQETERHGFRAKGLKAIHYHGVPPVFGAAHSQVHVAIANMLEEFDEPALLPQASSFMLQVITA